jgi:hypothetical protein
VRIVERSQIDGQSFEKRVAALVEGLQYDITFLYVIIDIPKISFGLSGLKLLYAVRKILLAITRAGAKPVRNATGPGTQFRIATDYGDTPEAITRTTMRKWQSGGYGGRGGDNDVWFAGPADYNLPWTEADMLRERQWRERERADDDRRAAERLAKTDRGRGEG